MTLALLSPTSAESGESDGFAQRETETETRAKKGIPLRKRERIGSTPAGSVTDEPCSRMLYSAGPPVPF